MSAGARIHSGIFLEHPTDGRVEYIDVVLSETGLSIRYRLPDDTEAFTDAASWPGALGDAWNPLRCESCGGDPIRHPQYAYWRWPADDAWCGEGAGSCCWEWEGTPSVRNVMLTSLLVLGRMP